LFAPPDTIFSAPDDTIFEAPAAAGTVSETTNDTKQETSAGEAASASLLLLMAPRLSLLTNLLGGHAFDDGSDTDKSESSDTPNEHESPAAPERRLIGVTGNRFRLDIEQWPLLGSPSAKYVFVEMFDYTCPHCRNTNRAVKGAFKHFGDDLAVIALPVPLDRKCNNAATGSGGMHRDSCEISRIAVGVWRIDPVKFHQLHDWIFERQRTAAATRRHAETLVGTAALNKELKYPTAGEYISKHVLLYKRVGAGSVPKLMFPNASMVGEVTSTQVLCRRIERELDAGQ